MSGLRLHTTHERTTPANVLDRDGQDRLLTRTLHFGRTMVGLPPMLILALGTTALVVLTGASSNGCSLRPNWDSAKVQLDAETFINTLASSGDFKDAETLISTLASSGDFKDQQMAAFLKVWDAEAAHLQISLLVKLPKTAKAKIFSRNLRENQFSTLPQELSNRGEIYYSKEQKVCVAVVRPWFPYTSGIRCSICYGSTARHARRAC